MAAHSIKRGDVVVVNLNPTKGSEQQGATRPCVVVQNDVGNQFSNTTIIVPVTAAEGKVVYPFMSLIENGDGGLTKDSLALCNQVRVISTSRIARKIGSLSGDAAASIDQALRSSLAL